MALDKDFKFIDEVGTDRNLFQATYEDGKTEEIRLNRLANITVNGTPLNAENLNKLVEAIIEAQETKNIITIGGKVVTEITFTSDPQEQIDNINKEIISLQTQIDASSDIEELTITNDFITSVVANGAEVGSICEVEKIEGKSVASANLWNEQWELGGITSTGELEASSTMIRSVGYISILPNTPINFLCSSLVFVAFYDSDKTFIEMPNGFNGIKTTPSNASYMIFRLQSSYGTTYLNDITITYDTSITTYTPYYSGFKHVNIGKIESTGLNIFDEQMEIGTISNDGTLSDVTTNIRSKNFTDVIPNASFKLIFSESAAFYYYDSNYNFISYDYTSSSKSVYVVPNNATKMKFRYGVNYGTTYKNDTTMSYNLDLTEYVPYEVLDSIDYNVELKQYDYIYGVKHYTQSESVTFNGTESGWYSAVTGNNVRYFRANLSVEALNNVVLNDASYTYSRNESDMTLYTGGTTVRFFDNRFDSLDEWKAHLSENPITIVYQTTTATETYLDIYPYLLVKKNGNLTFTNTEVAPKSTITYPLNIKAEVTRLSILANSLDNELIALKKSTSEEIATLENNLNNAELTLKGINDYFEILETERSSATLILMDVGSAVYTATLLFNLGVGAKLLNYYTSRAANLTVETDYDKTTGIATISYSSPTSQKVSNNYISYRKKDINDLL